MGRFKVESGLILSTVLGPIKGPSGDPISKLGDVAEQIVETLISFIN
jgi:hypothetical protein